VTELRPGLFGKLPAHGDFVDRGWPAAQVAALDGWLTAGIAAIRAGHDDEAFAAALTEAPLWRGYLPAGACGPEAMHLTLAPSIDSAGRYFFIAGGVAGTDAAAWAVASQFPAFAEAVEAATYDALAGRHDADSYAAAIAAAVPAPGAAGEFLAGMSLPAASLWWWTHGDAPAGFRAEAVDTALLARLVAGGSA